jgi:hypothetical protein
LQADVRAVFKAVQGLHKEGWEIEEPSVKAHAAMGRKVLIEDICCALLESVSWHLQQHGWLLSSRGQLVEASVLDPLSDAKQAQRIVLSCESSAPHSATLEVSVQTFKKQTFSVDELLDGTLSHRWQQTKTEHPDRMDNQQSAPLVREVNAALHATQCRLLPGMKCVPPCMGSADSVTANDAKISETSGVPQMQQSLFLLPGFGFEIHTTRHLLGPWPLE